MRRWGVSTKARTRHVPGTMNKTEGRFADYLQLRKLATEIIEWGFEEITLKLAKDCRFTPDFWVLHSDGEFEFVEVKGGTAHKLTDKQGAKVKTGRTVAYFGDEGAKPKLQVAGDKFPFRFTLAFEEKTTKAWIFEDFTQWENV